MHYKMCFLCQALAQNCAQKLRDLVGTKESQGHLPHAVLAAARTGGQHPAHTTGGKMEQALRWLDNPGMNDGGVGLNAVRSLLDEARRLANQLPPQVAKGKSVDFLPNKMPQFCLQRTVTGC
jgi:hypothetical protein